MVSIVLFSISAVARFCFCDGRTDTLRENNDHLFGRGLVGQQDLSRTMIHVQAPTKVLAWKNGFTLW